MPAIDSFSVIFILTHTRIDLDRSRVLSAIQKEDWKTLWHADQLIRQRTHTSTPSLLCSFDEGPLSFPPTYKYDSGTQNYDSSEKKRIPAWCDRILYRDGAFRAMAPPFLEAFAMTLVSDENFQSTSSPPNPFDDPPTPLNPFSNNSLSPISSTVSTAPRIQATAAIIPHLLQASYQPFNSCTISDHRPICSTFKITTKKIISSESYQSTKTRVAKLWEHHHQKLKVDACVDWVLNRIVLDQSKLDGARVRQRVLELMEKSDFDFNSVLAASLQWESSPDIVFLKSDHGQPVDSSKIPIVSWVFFDNWERFMIFNRRIIHLSIITAYCILFCMFCSALSKSKLRVIGAGLEI